MIHQDLRGFQCPPMGQKGPETGEALTILIEAHQQSPNGDPQFLRRRIDPNGTNNAVQGRDAVFRVLRTRNGFTGGLGGGLKLEGLQGNLHSKIADTVKFTDGRLGEIIK
jgi:hypothetical protein